MTTMNRRRLTDIIIQCSNYSKDAGEAYGHGNCSRMLERPAEPLRTAMRLVARHVAKDSKLKQEPYRGEGVGY